MVDSTDFAQVLAEADDIAQSVGQKLTTAHVLLALFTVENRAQVLLRDRGIDEDRLLASMTSVPVEDEALLADLSERSRDIARRCGSLETDCLHWLIGAIRVRCAAQDLLLRSGLDLNGTRNIALSYYLSGRMPRKLQLGRQSRQAVVAQPRPSISPSVKAPAPTADETSASEEPARNGFDAVEEPPPPSPTLFPGRNSDPELDSSAFPLLASLGRNLTLLAKEAKLDPVVGRSREIDEIIDILGKRRTNNPCLVGEPGVGKTAVVEGVAQRLAQSGSPSANRIIVELETASLLAGTQLRGSFSEKLNRLKDEVRKAHGRVVVFIDELHTLVGAGATGDGPQDAANELKSAMSRGEFPCIGATTHDEFRKFISSDPALERRLSPVVINEPSVSQTVEILLGVIPRYEAHHRLRYSREALGAAASMAAKYVSDRFLPDKAISIADLAGSRCRREGKSVVEPADVARVVASLAGIPEERLLMTDSARLLGLEKQLGCRIVGHSGALARIAQVVRRNYAGFANHRPMGSFLLIGPTGVGKTELARALADVLFGSADALVALDMSELSEPHAVSRLIGAPAGYVGYGDGGQLTEPVRRRPSSVILLDEVEKAHRDVQMLLLQILEEGRLTDGKGRHIDFSNAVLMMTSNLGAHLLTERAKTLGFGAAANAIGAPAASVERAVREALPPELWNRIDERLVLHPLDAPQLSRILRMLLAQSSQRLEGEKGIRYAATDRVIDHLTQPGSLDARLGARPLRQFVQRLVEAPLAERILAGEFSAGDFVRVDVGSGELTFERAIG
jgi:ATP-dependent Clp protease ATP-binding subunit ClpC